MSETLNHVVCSREVLTINLSGLLSVAFFHLVYVEVSANKRN